ncbi:hypothetical protein NliqN6_5317 [Naganishia liquefaciens]|uniref:Uncharacterized protein n=1 Tax=Naganishia liquefaciens TaxID=104408 RepID=A0A8H3YGJ0_9TREE|nr:hypothetical protein NliqN6_5317 [Naganishia liquefaciens]
MSTQPLLPPFHYESKRKSSSVVTVRKLLAALLLVTAANVFTFTHPQTSARYIAKVHHKVAKWTSFPAIVRQFVQDGESMSRPPSRVQDPSYVWVSSGRTLPLAPEPGIDPVNAGFEEPLPARRITGAPGSDLWTQEDVDEDLETIFDVEEFTASNEVRAPLAWRMTQEESEAESDSDRPAMTWDEITQTVEEYAPTEDEPEPLTGEALWQFIEERIDWDLRHAGESP